MNNLRKIMVAALMMPLCMVAMDDDYEWKEQCRIEFLQDKLGDPHDLSSMSSADVFNHSVIYLPEDLREAAWEHFRREESVSASVSKELAETISGIYHTAYWKRRADYAEQKDLRNLKTPPSLTARTIAYVQSWINYFSSNQ